MKKPGLVLFLAGCLLIAMGLLIYLAFSNPKISAKARLVRQPLTGCVQDEGREKL
jgi:hypothetical protein